MFVESIALSSLVRQHLLNLLLHVHCFCVVLVNMIFFPKHRHFAKTIRQKEDLEKNRIEKLKSWKSGLQICRDRGHLRPYPLHRGVTHDPVVSESPSLGIQSCSLLSLQALQLRFQLSVSLPGDQNNSNANKDIGSTHLSKEQLPFLPL